MSRGAIRDLADAPGVAEIVLADRVETRGVLEERAEQWCRGKAAIRLVDLGRPEECQRAIRGSAALINSTPYYFNLPIMDLCLAEGVHYVDMGGLFHVCRKQMEQDEAWKQKGLTAVLGMGSAPGIVNVMSRVAADRLDRVESIRITDGIVNFAPSTGPMAAPYALSTIMDEFTMNPFVFDDGDWRELKPFAGEEVIDFPAPVGTQTVYCMLHSEVATLPVSFKDKGIRHVSFKLALPKTFEERLRFLVDLGFGSKESVEVNGSRVTPRDVLIKLTDQLNPPPSKPDDHKVLRVDVAGEKGGQRQEIRCEMICHPYEPWDMATGPHTVGAPCGVVARLLGSDAITERGALPAEACVPPRPFFSALAERGMHATVSVRQNIV